MTAHAIAPDAEHESCVDTGVLVVHGIGVQPRNSTLESYGGAIERLWTSFHNEEQAFTASDWIVSDGAGSQPNRAIELHGAKASVTVGECHWDPAVDKPPSLLRLAYWITTVVPASLIFSCRYPSRLTGQGWRRWLARCSFAIPVLGLFLPLVVLALILVTLARAIRLIDRSAVDAVAKTVGDAFHFTSHTPEAERMVQLLVDRARQVSEGKERLVVVAHSQGGAVTWRALGRPDWPDVTTEVITLGSGHFRLLTLRSFRRSGLSRIALFLWNACVILSSMLLTLGLGYTPGLFFDDAGGGALGVLAAIGGGLSLYIFYGLAIVLVFGSPMLVAQQFVSRAISKRISEKTAYWLDIWASRDLVPDGPVNTSVHASLRVVNRRSLIHDHTTYHENAAGVVATVLHRAAPDRLASGHALVQSMRAARDNEYRLTWRRKHKRRLGSDETIHAEFCGEPISTAVEAAGPPEPEVSVMPEAPVVPVVPESAPLPFVAIEPTGRRRLLGSKLRYKLGIATHDLTDPVESAEARVD